MTYGNTLKLPKINRMTKKLKNLQILKTGQSIEKDCHKPALTAPDSSSETPQVGFDRIDSLPVTTLPECVSQAAEGTMVQAATALCGNQTERKQALIRLVARTVQQSRVQLKYFEALRNTALAAYVEGRGPAQKLEIIERTVQRQHRRLFDALNFMSRLDPQQTPVVQVKVDQAAVLFKGET